MRHFRGSRGSRRRSFRPTVRTSKYIVVSGPSSEVAGIQAVSMALGTDNATLGQTGVTDIAVPTGAKITHFEIFMPKGSTVADETNFHTWTIQKLSTGQAIINPITAGGDPLRKNIMLTGMIALGITQNNGLHISYNVPLKKQRMADGDSWQIVMNNQRVTKAQYYIIYKVQM